MGHSDDAKDKKLTVCVYCGSSPGSSPEYNRVAEELGKVFHDLQWKVVYGGGTSGIMGTIARSTMGGKMDGDVLGIIPYALVEREQQNASSASEEYGKTTFVPDMHTRKAMMARESNAFVALPGGYGTLEEIMECITWSQLGIHCKPIIIFNVNGFYDKLLDFIEHTIKEGFVSKGNREIIAVANSVDEVVDKILNYQVSSSRMNLDWGDI